MAITRLQTAQKQAATISKFAHGDFLSGVGDFFSGGGFDEIPSGGFDFSDTIANAAAAGLCATLPDFLVDTCNRITGGGGGGGMGLVDPGKCPPGRIRVGTACVKPSAALPGGVPLTTQAGGQAVQGAFGMPATTPDFETRTTRRCPKRMVLGFDDLCYPKAILPRRSKFRKWRGEPRPTLSVGDEKAIRRANRAKDRVLKLAKEAGLHASKSRPAPRKKSSGHIHGGTLKILEEVTN